MVSRASYRRWLLLDLPQTYVVFGCAAVIVGVLIYSYSIDWAPFQHETAVRPQLNNANSGNDEQRYTGSIILPTRGDRCWEGMFDNRTGRMIDLGNVNCDKAALHLAEKISR